MKFRGKSERTILQDVTLIITGFFLIMATIFSLAAPPMLYAESIGNQEKETAEDADTLTFLSSDMPPFGTLQQDGKKVGFTVEILHEIMQRLGRADIIEFDRWKVVYERVLTEPDTVLWPPSRTPEREELFKWVGPLIPEKIVLFARKDSGLIINSLEDAKRVGGIATVTGYSSEKLLKKKGFTNLVSQRSPIQGPDALKFSRVDLWINSNITMKQTALDANVDPGLFEPVFVVKEIPSYLAFSKSVPDELVNQWQNSLDDIKRDGTWEGIVSNWIPHELLRIGEGSINLSEKERLWIEAHPVIRASNELDWPPFDFFQNGEAKGFSIDYLRLIARKTGLNLEFVQGLTWKEILEHGKVRKLDILHTMDNTAERREYLSFSKPYAKDLYVLAVIPGSKITTLADLTGKKIAVLKGDNFNVTIRKNQPEVEFVEFSKAQNILKAVINGETEAASVSAALANYLINKEFLPALEFRNFGMMNDERQPYHIGVRNDWPELLSIINKGADAISFKEFNELREKWLGLTITRTPLGTVNLSPAEAAPTSPAERLGLTPEEMAHLSTIDEILFCADPDWMPYERINEEGEYQGMVADFIVQLSERMNIPFTLFQTLTWQQSLEKMGQGDCDIIASAAITPQRLEWLDFTTPHYSFPLVIAVRSEELFVEDLAAVSDKTLGVVKGYAHIDLIRKQFPSLKIRKTKNVKEGLRLVQDGRIFGFIDTVATIGYTIRHSNMLDLKIGGKLDIPLDLSIALRKGEDPVLLAILNKAISSFTDAEKKALMDKWVAVTFETTFDYSMLWKVMAGGFCVILLFVYRNRQLASLNQTVMESNEELLRTKTNLEQSKREADKARNEAEGANRTKSEFLANMSHELRTPLNAILGFSELMIRDPGISSEQRGNLETIGRSGEHLLSLINDVLEFSKIEAGCIVLHKEKFDLHRLLLGLEEMFSLRTRQKGLFLNFVRTIDVPQYIQTDQKKLRQILINLLGNALKFTETGGITLSVTCVESNKSTPTSLCSLQIEVTDTGVGIAAEEQARVFDAFSQVGSLSLSQQGTGLGLPISQQFVSMMDGSLEVHSDIGRQTTFTIVIPIEPADEPGSEPTQLGHEVTGLASGQPTFRLLVVEDDDNNRNLLVNLLKVVGFEVKEANNGQEALDIWDKWSPNLIWMDTRMPVMDGYAATSRIKSSADSKDTVIIALTASAFEEDRRKALEQGCNDFVRKPFREKEIFEMLEKHLGVKFVYMKEDERHTPLPVRQISIEALKSEAAALPVETLVKLAEATELSDTEMINLVIKDIQIHNAVLADTLWGLADNFAYDKILALVQRAQTSKGIPK